MSTNLLPLTAAPVEQRRLTGASSPYRAWYMAVLDGKVPAEQRNGRWYLSRESIAAAAPLLRPTMETRAA